MDKLWSERGYFVLLGNVHILVYYPTISYQRIKFYRVETMDMGRFSITMVSVENKILVSNVVFIVWDKILR